MDTLFPSSTLFRSRYRPARLARRAAGRGRRPPRRPRADRRALPRDAHAAARMSLDARIRADIEARIRSGAWPPGHRIPFEHELTATYGCSRATVSKALGALARAGIIDRRKRAGTFVAHPPHPAAVLDGPGPGAESGRAGGGERGGKE